MPGSLTAPGERNGGFVPRAFALGRDWGGSGRATRNQSRGVDILAGSTVTNTGPTIITGGDLALSPGSAVTGFPPGPLTTPAVMHVTDPTAAQAQVDLTTAYTLYRRVSRRCGSARRYEWLDFHPGPVQDLEHGEVVRGQRDPRCQGDVNAIFIFQVASTLTTIGGTQVVLAGGAQAKNVFWQTGSSATLGTNSIFKGTIMALQSITLKTGATLQGRALAPMAPSPWTAMRLTHPKSQALD